MRQQINFNQDWVFVKQDLAYAKVILADGEKINLPHTWNAADGQDGGNDYYRGRCWYRKEFARPQTEAGQEVWVEFAGVAMTADVYINGEAVGHHEGGYSTFRVNITDYLQDENLLVVSADNQANQTVYPQVADFTFYGGIYRDVTMLIVPKEHFALQYYGSPAIRVTPALDGDSADVQIEVWVEHSEDGREVEIEIAGVASQSCNVLDGYACGTIRIEAVHRWDGLSDPYLYTAIARLSESGDEIKTAFGCRTIAFDPERGFFLNGRSYRLCGASRHQDRKGVGNALTRAMHEEDMRLLKEMGANTLRLAHYQHDAYFYDLADRYGMIVWAEIPYITEHMPTARANTVSQMKELIIQNYNHPSIVCWGLSNEISTMGGVTDDLLENHRILNDLCHQLDATRPTTMASIFVLNTDSELLQIPDINSYNLYHGWYVGVVEDMDKWFDDFHAKYPHMVIGLSEYGADANPKLQNAAPGVGDYTEGYQALYHEHMMKMWLDRPFIWAMHVWNMFDFAADARNEGDNPGINQKGLITLDRKLKKDAFYLYKAYLSDEPFVHICGRRYADRAEAVTEIKVYSNQNHVTLSVDGQEYAAKPGEKIFCFELPITGQHTIEAVSGELKDSITIRKVDTPNPEYRLVQGGIVNWFEKEDIVREGFYSIKDTMGDLRKSPAAAALLDQITAKAMEGFGEVAQNVQIDEAMQRRTSGIRLEAMLKQVGKGLTKEMVVGLNRALNQIPKL